MSETVAKFDMCTRRKPLILKLNRRVHLESLGIILGGELKSIGGWIQISYVATGTWKLKNQSAGFRFLHAVVGTAENEAPVVFHLDPAMKSES